MTESRSAGKPATPPTQPDDPLAELLCQLDEFLRSHRPAVTDALIDFMKERGYPHPGFAACNLIDELCFTAYRHRHADSDQDH